MERKSIDLSWGHWTQAGATHFAPFPLTNAQTPTTGLNPLPGLQRDSREGGREGGREKGGRNLLAGNQLCHTLAMSKWPPVWASASSTVEQGKQNHSQACLAKVIISITISRQLPKQSNHHLLTIGVT